MQETRRIALLIDCDNVTPDAIEGVLEELAKHVADEKIVVTCDTVFSLSRAPEALAYVAAGHVVGRVLVEVLEGSCGDIQPSNSAIL